ncbi:MAG: hypothetical protein IKB96_05375 [Prevotella sp.]|nr:hypothetical protein [Prevotella sp.]
MEKAYLIGSDKYGNVVYANLRINERNEKRTFSASFCTYEPFNMDEFDLEEHYEMFCEEADKEHLYDLCCGYGCAPSELPSYLVNDTPSVHDELNTNGEEIEVNGDYWAFRLISYGQHDTSDQMVEFVNEEAYNMIMALWKNHHLEEATDEVMEQMNKIDALLADVDEDAWLTDYIERVYA